MATHPALRRFGFQGRELELADSYLRAQQHLGRSHAEAMAVVTWYAKAFGPNAAVTMEDLSLAFDIEAKRRGWSAEIVENSYGWNAAIAGADGDPAVIRALPAPGEHARETRLEEIRALCRDDPAAYDADKSLQDEHEYLLDARRDANARGAYSSSSPTHLSGDGRDAAASPGSSGRAADNAGGGGAAIQQLEHQS